MYENFNPRAHEGHDYDQNNEMEDMYEFIIDKLNYDYYYPGMTLRQIIINAEEEKQGAATEIINIIYDIIDEVEKDIDYFVKWEKEISKALGQIA